MPRLIFTDADGARREVRLDRPRVRVGRGADCELVLDDDGVSRTHAVLIADRGGWIVEDAGSRNGTFVNDAPIERRVLEHGDRLRLGRRLELEYRDDDAAGAPPRARPAAASRHDSGDDRDEEAADGLDEDDRDAGTRHRPGRRAGGAGWLRERRFVLVPVEGEAPDIPIRSAVTTVGRDANAGARLDDDSVSRMHARLDREGDALRVTDLKSRNGVRVNGDAVLRARLEDGDRVRFGDVELELRTATVWAWGRVAALVVALLVLGIGAVGVARLGDWLGERADVATAERRLKARALTSVRQGIDAYRRGDLDYARGYLLYAGDVLLLSGLAPPGASLSRPQDVFRGIARELPPEDRDIDFAKLLDPDAVVAQRARLEGLSNREYVERQIKRIVIELGQDEDVPPGFVDQVWAFVESASRNPGWFQAILDRSPRVHPRLREILAEAHLPEVFCYVAWIESGLRPTITSPAGARGTWQFMEGTARQYGLRVDPGRGIDERTDVVKSTRAATGYVGNLIRTFGREQFMCALASYNRGESAVRRAMEKIADPMMPSSRKYWYLVDHGYLPRETSEYVPKIIGARILAEDPERFGLRRPGS